ncbi:murein hydrolase activator EnvC [Mangrovimonas sp. YM274]|uniref:murein hydrolase activator EnvC family protein n=1 Tax=Mangrovimonas sp. YM274 TaxID=3070660 RepID=UPI0027DD6431|nr:peptidoglycan DD-metalloendopeptidase family protein [Mangrovimonas sp. YM274]WMI68887.1 peptidoglycan DD-metalloendopeptidase family protein [Mangrovimonas sp. YM274]
MRQTKATYIIFIICVFMGSVFAQAQSDKQKQLEARRLQLKKEMEQLNSLLFANKKKEKNVITLVEDLNYKVSVRKNLIKVTNDQANLLTRDINNNQKQISDLRDQLKELKEQYAAMIVKSYKNKSQLSRVMFLMSSTNFKQAYKRLQYIKQYSDYQKQQGEEIKAKTAKLQKLNTELLKQKEDKQKLVEENRIAKRELEAELKEHEVLMASIRSNMTKYNAQLKQKQKESDRIDKEIDRLIKEAIAASNKKAGKSKNSSAFALTPEAKALAATFEANKGKLPWPVVRGIVKMRFGKQPSAIDKTVTVNSKGVRIATEKGAKVRAVFDGEVSQIIAIPNANPVIIVRHGNYMTVYRNLSKIYVNKGDKVTAKQDLGEVFTNNSTGETLLYFRVYKDAKLENPAHWINKL